MTELLPRLRRVLRDDLDQGQRAALASWVSFTITFAAVRGITYSIRAYSEARSATSARAASTCITTCGASACWPGSAPSPFTARNGSGGIRRSR